MQEVLVPVDRNEERALAQAESVLTLAADRPVHAVLFHVFEDNPHGASVDQVVSVRRAGERLDENGVEVTLDSSSGDATNEILSRARERDVDIICMSGRNRTVAGKLIFGSVSRSVLLESDRPVLFCTT